MVKIGSGSEGLQLEQASRRIPIEPYAGCGRQGRERVVARFCEIHSPTVPAVPLEPYTQATRDNAKVGFQSCCGINTRSVRTYLRKSEALGKIETVRTCANRPTEFLVTILDEAVLERQYVAAPNSELDRQSTTEPRNGRSGSVASTEWQYTAYKVFEEDTPNLSASQSDGEDWIFAQKAKGAL